MLKTRRNVTIKPSDPTQKDDNMSDQKTIAIALMRGKLPSREIAGLIYDEADVEQPVAMQTPPPIENVEKAAKKSWVKAATAVMSKVPEYFGREVLGHKSKNLKHVYIEHGEDQETLQQLHGFVGTGYVAAESWAEKIDIEWLEKWAKGRELPWQIVGTIARRLMVEKRYETIAKWRHKTEHTRTTFLGGAVGYGIEQNDTAAVEALLAHLKTDKARKDAIWAGWDSAAGRVNETALHFFGKYHKDRKDLEERLLDAGCFAEPTSEANYIALLELLPAGGRSYDLIESDVAERYLATTLRYAEYNTIRNIIEKRIDAACGHSHFSSSRPESERERDHEMIEMCLEALARFEAGEEVEEIEGIFDQYPRTLSAEAKYQALRFGSTSTTWSWFGDEVNVPDSETFQRLLKNPGRGLPVKHDGSIDWGVFYTEGGATGSALFDLPFIQELLEAMGRYGTEMLLDEAAWEAQTGTSGPTVASEYLAEKFTEHLGDNLEAWRGAIRVLSTSTQPLGRTLRGVAKLYGSTRTA